MARSEDVLAKKIVETGEAAFPPAFYPRTERQRNFLLRDLEDDSIGGKAREFPAVEERPKRTGGENLLGGYILADCAALILGFLCGGLLAIAVNALILHRPAFVTLQAKDALTALEFFMLGAGVILWFGHSSHYQLRMPFWMETKKIVEAMGFAMLISCFLQFVGREDFSRVWLVACWIFSAISMISFRSLLRMIWSRRGKWHIPTLVIGSGPTAEEAGAALHSEPSLGYRPVAQIKDLPAALRATGNSWTRLCQAWRADHVLIALAGDDFINARPLLAQLMREHIPFSVSPPMHNLSVFGMVPQCFLGHDVMLLVRNSGLDRPLSRFIKRSFDVAMSSLGLLALSPVLLLTTIAVKLDGGPALYRHKRVGLQGQVFYCLKFRSMVAKSDVVLRDHLAKNAEARIEWMRDHKLRRDPRITMVGSFLRRTSLDELPQLINVLRGEMSIVGPRPIILAEAAKYNNDIAFYYRVRPGITGLWQVSGRNDVSYDDRVRMDSWYVRNWSLWHDITIICKTFSVVLKQRGAY
jgi:Undecaprenyl-phosphate galactose phosphotransferase WbaP